MSETMDDLEITKIYNTMMEKEHRRGVHKKEVPFFRCPLCSKEMDRANG